jgi:MFS family permease
VPDPAPPAGRLGLLPAMAMFVLVVDTSLMNVSISAVVRDLDTTVSSVQSAIALEALVSAAFILIGGFITTYLSWRVAFLLEAVVIAVVLSGIKLVREVPYTGSRRVDPVGAVLSVLGMGGVVLGILVWQEAARPSARCWRPARRHRGRWSTGSRGASAAASRR